MTVIQLATAQTFDFLLRQSRDGDGRWGGIRLVPGSGTGEGADWLVVYDQPPRGLATRLPRARRIVFLPEPVSIKHYDPAFISQFGIAVTSSPLPGFDGEAFHMQPSSPWFYGAGLGASAGGMPRLGFAELAAREVPCAPERGLISAVCSTKTLNRNQVRRLRFLRRAKAALGARLDIYGRGFREVADKAEGLDGYRYHLVLENNLDPHCWTEKMADPLLAGAYPIVAGGPELEGYFDPLGFTALDITRPDTALKTLLAVLEADPVARVEVQEAMRENRRRLMEEHQVFPVLDRLVAGRGEGAPSLLAEAEPIRPPARAPYRRLTQALRPLRRVADRLHLALFERG